jgi:hypothetical protein
MNLSWIDKLQAKAAEEISQVWSQSVRTKQLRSFGLIVGCIFLVLGLGPVVPLLRHRHTWHPWLVLIAIVLILPAILWPRLLRHPYRAWMLLGHILGWVNSRVVLGFLFFLIFTPVSVALWLSGRDSMRRSFDRKTDTYRVRKTFRPTSHLKHQF